MSITDLIFLIITVGLIFYTGWFLIPRSVYLLFPSAIKCSFMENQHTLTKQKEKILVLLNEIQNLGFIKLGTKIEKPPLWARGVGTIIFTSTNASEIVSVFVVGKKTIYYFLTLFNGGQIVLTANNYYKTVNTDYLYQSVVTTNNPEEVLEIHRKHVETFGIKGFTPVREYTEKTILSETSIYYKFPEVRKGMRIAGATNLVLFIIFCLPLIYVIYHL